VNMLSTEHLLGGQDLYDATTILRRYASTTPAATLAATYERAVFDLLNHFVSQGKNGLNYQVKDIDDAVDFEKVKIWIQTVGLPREQSNSMLEWLNKA